MSAGRDEAVERDRADPLAAFRDRFVVADPELVYLDGNSLGRLPRVTQERLQDVVAREWGDRLIRAWWEEWLELPVSRRRPRRLARRRGSRPGARRRLDDRLPLQARLGGARSGREPNGDRPRARRVSRPTATCSQGLAEARGLELCWVDAPDEIAAVLGPQTALVVLSHVNYRSAAVAPLDEITGLVHEAGALVLWDLCHSAGALPVGLDAAGADLAVGCTYKYLNAGPGAPAFLYVRRDLQDELRHPIWGWFGRRDQFEMAQGYEPAAGISAWLSGTPNVLGVRAVEAGAELVAEAGIDAIHAKARALTDFVVELHDERLAPLGFTLGSPREAERRGAHVSVCRPDAEALCAALAEHGVITDFRMPDAIRLGCSPLTTSYAEAWDGVERLAELAG